jgi:hypothetical protein
MSRLREVIPIIFPGSSLEVGRSEVNGLSKGTAPQNCKILMQGQEKFNCSRREFYLIEVENLLIFLRVCEAYPESGYDEFAVIRDWQFLGTTDADEMKNYATRTINCICEINEESCL